MSVPTHNSGKKICADVGGQSKTCRNNNTATWTLK